VSSAAAAVSIKQPGGIERTDLNKWAVRIGPPLVYLMLALYYYSDFLAHPTRGAPGGPDGIIYSWYFEAVEQAVVHGRDPLFTAGMNAPIGVSLMWNTSVLLLALVCVPLTATIGPIAAVGLMMTLSPVASACAMYYVLRKLTGNSAAAALASLLYGFGPFFVGQNGHLHLTFAVFPPLLLLFGYRLLVSQDEPALRTGVKLGIVAGLSLLATEEIVAMAAAVATFALAVLMLVNVRAVRARVHHAVVGLGIAAATTLVIAGGPLAVQLFGPLSIHGVPPTSQRLDLAGLVRPSNLQYYSSASSQRANIHFSANSVENTGYLGWPLIALVVVLCAWLIVRHDRFVYWWIPTALFTVGLSLGTPVVLNRHRIGPGLWSVFGHLPLLKGTIVIRFSLFTTLLVVLLIARALGPLRGKALVMGLVVAAATFVPLRPHGPYDAIGKVDTPRFFTTPAVNTIRPGSTALLLPVGTGPYTWVLPMTWQLRSHFRFNIIGGYSVFKVDGRMSYSPELPMYARLLRAVGKIGGTPSESDLERAMPSVRQSGTNVVIITAQQPNASLVTAIAARLTGCVPRQIADVTVCEVN
jgi:hypothetical protein